MEDDRKSIGLTPETQRLLAELEQREWFQENQDLARFCLAYSIRAKVPEGTTSGTETRWAVGNFDETGEIRALISALYPACKTPVRLMEYLVNEGIHRISERLRSEAIGPADLMS